MLNRRPDESVYQYHKRLIFGKMLDRTMSDIDYSEMAEPLYGKELSSDSVRKMMYGSCLTLQLLESECTDTTADTALDELEAKRIELRKERQRLSDQRREYNKLVSASGRFEYMTERLVESADRLNVQIGLLKYDPVEYECAPCEAILILNDWHYGLKTHNIWNSYDIPTCVERATRVFADATQRLKMHRPRKLHILVLGDMCHGAIHNSARVASEELVCDQIMQVSEILAQLIHEISAHVPEVEVHVTYGNHMRTVQNKGDSIHRDNMERLIPWWLSQRLKDADNIKVAEESETELLSIMAAGFGIVASHGDLDSLHTSPKVLSVAFRNKLGIDLSCVVFGDKHHSEEFEELGIRSMIAGSLCGTDDHANGKRLYSTPEQLMLFCTDGYGLDAIYHLHV